MKNYYLSQLLVLVALMGVSVTLSFGQTLEVTAPASIAGTYVAPGAGFGGVGETFSGELVLVTDVDGNSTACVAIDNGVADVTGKIALIDRGDCAFETKIDAAEAAGAIAAIICNNDTANPDASFNLVGTCDTETGIPAAMISYNDCQTIRMETGITVDYTGEELVHPNEYYNQATPIGDGTYTIDSLTGSGSLFTGFEQALYYEYTASGDGLLNVNSCGGGTDTYLTLWTCGLGVIGQFDDQCDEGNGEGLASEAELLVEEGDIVIIVWDAIYTTDGFDFSVTLEEELPSVEGTFSVDMNNETVGPDGVTMLVGRPGVTDVGEVEAVPLTDDDGDGVWSGTYTATTTDTIGYAFMNGALDPANVEMVPDDCGLPSGFGFNIRPFIVTSLEAYNVPTVCFSLCTTCPVVGLNCDEPLVIISEDFEGQTVGEEPTSDFMIDWPGTTSLGTISDEYAASGSLSHRITGTGADVDPVYLLPGAPITSGHYIVSWNMLVEDGNLAYYNFQKNENQGTADGGEWAFQLYFDGDGTGRLEAGSASAAEPRATFTYPVGEWFPIVHVVDVDNNLVRVHVNGRWVSSWPLNWQPFEQMGLQSFGAVNFYPANTDNLWFVDDFLFAQIPEPGDGLYCQSATEITPGMYTVAEGELDCFGAGIFYDVDDGSGLQSRWFSYTAEEDGYITVSSCEGGDDTRAYILGGTCDDLAILSANDDRCELEPGGSAWASLLEAPVTAGETYYIVHDDYWSPVAYDWELTFTSGALPEGNFCQSAIAVDPGVYTIGGFGEASVGAGLLGASSNPTSSVFAPQLYAGAAWYSYTPSEDQTITISSCASGEDTYLNVYTGECGTISSLELLASNDDFDDCSPSSQLELDVTAGTTYYIEWMDLYTDVAHEWELSTVNLTTVTFQVDASLLVDNGELSAEGIFLAGGFNGFTGEPMNEGADNIWTLTLDIEPGTYTYKFQNGPGGWENIDTSVGDDCTVGAYNDREVVVEDMEITTDLVCFGFCVTCDMVPSSVSDEALQSSVHVFPNPARDLLNVQIDLPEAADNLNVRLVNTFGQVVSEQYLGQLQSDNIELDLSKVPAGAYMIQVRDGKSQYTESVIIQK